MESDNMKKALIAMSGGVDSSVAAYLMKEHGYDCIGVTMKLFQNEDAGVSRKKSCCSLDDVEDARSVAHNLGIPYYVFNFTADFKKQVMDRFVAAYENGATPNPCIDCNRYLKFNSLYHRAEELGCHYVVTGHYARIEKREDGRYLLKKAADPAKDQSYVLYSLTQEQLDKQDDLAVENALVDQVIESMEGEIPQAMYDARMDEMVNDFAFRVEQQGLRLEDYLKYMGQTMEQFRASFMPQAEKQVKIRLALEAVAAAENIEASEDELNAEVKRIADQYKMEEDKVRELVNVDDLKKDLAINKAIDFIKSHANIVEKAAEEEKAADAE